MSSPLPRRRTPSLMPLQPRQPRPALRRRKQKSRKPHLTTQRNQPILRRKAAACTIVALAPEGLENDLPEVPIAAPKEVIAVTRVGWAVPDPIVAPDAEIVVAKAGWEGGNLKVVPDSMVALILAMVKKKDAAPRMAPIFAVAGWTDAERKVDPDFALAVWTDADRKMAQRSAIAG